MHNTGTMAPLPRINHQLGFCDKLTPYSRRTCREKVQILLLAFVVNCTRCISLTNQIRAHVSLPPA